MKYYRKRGDLFWGMLFIIGALVILFNQFVNPLGVGVFTIIATIVLAAVIIRSIPELSFFGIFMPLGFLAVLYSEELHIEDFTPWPALLTALLLSIGFSILFKHPKARFEKNFKHFDHSRVIENDKDSNVVNCVVNFGDTVKYVNSDNFELANIKCSFGAAKIYFDHAVIPSGKAIINVETNFGETQLFIPKTWNVVNEMNVFLGDFKEYNQGKGLDVPLVTIRGGVNFGDVKIFYI